MLVYQGKKDALASLLFITDKRNMDTKTKKVDVGSKHITYDWYDKRNGWSSTVNTESVFLTEVIDVYEHRDQEMLDIDNAFLHTKNYWTCWCCFVVIWKNCYSRWIKKLYQKYVTTLKQGVSMIYAKLTKALYGMFSSAMLFYNKLKINLEEIGCDIN